MYSKEEILQLLEKHIDFTLHAINMMDDPSRNLTKDEVIDAIRRGKIVGEEIAEPCNKVEIQAYSPTIFVVIGVCKKEQKMVVITTYRGVKYD